MCFSGEHDVSDEYETQTFITKANPLEIVVPRRFYIRPGQGTIIYDVAILVMENPVDFTNPSLRQIRHYIQYLQCNCQLWFEILMRVVQTAMAMISPCTCQLRGLATVVGWADCFLQGHLMRLHSRRIRFPTTLNKIELKLNYSFQNEP